MNLKLKYFLPFALFLLTSAANAQKNATVAAFSDNERLQYVGAYSLTFIYSEVARVDIGIEHLDYGNYQVTGEGNTFRFYDNFFKVRDFYQTRFRLQDGVFRSQYFFRNIREDDYTMLNTYFFDWDAKTVSGEMVKRSNPPTPFSLQMEQGPNYSDVLTCFYNFRSQDFTGIAKGQTYSFCFVLDNKFYSINCEFQGKEVRKMKKFSNKRVNCLKFNFQVVQGETFKGNEIIQVWLTDDKNHIPVEFEFPIRIGHMRAYLSDYDNVKHPINFVGY